MTGIEVGVAVIIGVLLGRFLPNRRKGPKPAKSPQPVCGCGHHHSYHDAQTSACGYASSEYVGESPAGIAQYEPRHCSCRRYSGPVPMPEFYAPELSDGTP